MRLSETSIRRPVLASVMSLLLMLIGLVSFKQLSGARVPAHRRAAGQRQHVGCSALRRR
jgi:hypothetical protein